MKNLMLLLVVLLMHSSCAARVLYNPDNEAEFEQWCRKYRKVYASDEERFTRLQIFKGNLDYVKQRNAASRGLYTLELNTNGDIDFVVVMDPVEVTPSTGNRDSNTPRELDWRARGAVTSVSDQGRCGNCWIQGYIGALESAYFIKTGDLVELSVKELTDCLGGCHPGDFSDAHNFTSRNGVHRFQDYYSNARQKCEELPQDVPKLKSSKFMHVPQVEDMEAAMEQAVAKQPTIAGIDGTCIHFYKHGILQQANPKERARISHMVLIVGYGSKNGADYWIIKNSWGKDWGEKGYLRLRRRTSAVDGECGINIHVAGYPTVNTLFVPPLPPAPLIPRLERSLYRVWNFLVSVVGEPSMTH